MLSTQATAVLAADRRAELEAVATRRRVLRSLRLARRADHAERVPPVALAPRRPVLPAAPPARQVA